MEETETSLLRCSKLLFYFPLFVLGFCTWQHVGVKQQQLLWFIIKIMSLMSSLWVNMMGGGAELLIKLQHFSGFINNILKITFLLSTVSFIFSAAAFDQLERVWSWLCSITENIKLKRSQWHQRGFTPGLDLGSFMRSGCGMSVSDQTAGWTLRSPRVSRKSVCACFSGSTRVSVLMLRSTRTSWLNESVI